MAATFKTIHAHRITTNRLGLERVAHGGALVDYFNAVFLEDRQPLGRVVTSGLDRFHAALDQRFDIARVVGLFNRGQKGQVHAEWLVGHLAAAADLFGQRLGVGLRQCGDHAQAAGIGNRSGQLGVTNVMHAALNDRMLDAKEFCYTGFHDAQASPVHLRSRCRNMGKLTR